MKKALRYFIAVALFCPIGILNAQEKINYDLLLTSGTVKPAANADQMGEQ